MNSFETSLPTGQRSGKLSSFSIDMPYRRFKAEVVLFVVLIFDLTMRCDTDPIKQLYIQHLLVNT